MVNGQLPRLNTNTSFLNYLYITPPYIRVTYRAYDVFKNNGFDRLFFNNTISSNNVLDETNCPSVSDLTETLNIPRLRESQKIIYTEPGFNEAYKRCGGNIRCVLML